MRKCPNPDCEDGQVTVIDNGPPGYSPDAWSSVYPKDKQVDCSECGGTGEVEGPAIAATLTVDHTEFSVDLTVEQI